MTALRQVNLQVYGVIAGVNVCAGRQAYKSDVIAGVNVLSWYVKRQAYRHSEPDSNSGVKNLLNLYKNIKNEVNNVKQR